MSTVHRLPQFLSRPELHGLVRGNGDAFPGARIAALTFGHVHDFEHAEALNFQEAVFNDSPLERIQYLIDDTFGHHDRVHGAHGV